MKLEQIYKRFPNKEDCIKHLEEILWNSDPVCPYCKISYYSKVRGGIRYYCHSCNTSFSVTVKTLFHRTRIPLQKWLLGISLTLDTTKPISARKFADKLDINKDTAWSIQKKINRAYLTHSNLLNRIIEGINDKSEEINQ